MAQKIATVSTVFAACDTLDAAKKRWNRDDVRHAVGGGGYVVIDPLIKAWRELKPLREAAPSTPAELLHQVATSLETHITGFTAEAEGRMAETQQVFESTVAELAELVTTLENELEETNGRLQAVTAANTGLTGQLAKMQQSLNDAKTANVQLVAENDGLRGQIARLESEHQAAVEKLQVEARERAGEHAAERARINEEHASALASQSKTLTENAEQAENRLMVLLDLERQATKDSTSQLSQQLVESREVAQSNREKTIELAAIVRQLTQQNTTLASDHADKSAACAQLSTALDEEKARAASIQSAFDDYKEKHKISGDLGALQIAVAALQEKLEEKPRDS